MSSASSSHFLCSKGSIDPTKLPSLKKSNQRKIPAKWTDKEEHALVLYLKEQLPADGPNFVKKYFNNAAQHLYVKFKLTQQGGEKNGATCQTKWANVHLSLHYICAI
ncbi:hypothetical protein JVU11DRAFT_5665 [Chiua virens]|nr:hypothetical protein JVU11DRAFT_5665 [Chiua virens]